MIFREFDEAEYMRLVEKDTERQIAAFKEEIAVQKEQLSQQSEQLSQQEEQLVQKDEQLEKYRMGDCFVCLPIPGTTLVKRSPWI